MVLKNHKDKWKSSLYYNALQFLFSFFFKKVSMNRIYVNQKTQVVFPVQSVCPAVLGCLMVHIISLVDSGQQSILFALKTEP